MPKGAVYVGRPSKWGNPYNAGQFPNIVAVDLFRKWLRSETVGDYPEEREVLLASLPELKGKTLACWCKTYEICHADVLLEMANK